MLRRSDEEIRTVVDSLIDQSLDNWYACFPLLSHRCHAHILLSRRARRAPARLPDTNHSRHQPLSFPAVNVSTGNSGTHDNMTTTSHCKTPSKTSFSGDLQPIYIQHLVRRIGGGLGVNGREDGLEVCRGISTSKKCKLSPLCLFPLCLSPRCLSPLSSLLSLSLSMSEEGNVVHQR